MTEEEIAQGFTGAQPPKGDDEYQKASGFTVTELAVPGAIFEIGDEDEEDAPHFAKLDKLRTAIYQSAGYVGGVMIGEKAPRALFREGGFCAG